MKFVFLDTEFTGEHAYTTPVSFGLVTLDEKELYVTLNDYDKDQVTDWLKENVLSKINPKESVSKKEAYLKISSFLKNYSQGEKISLVSAGKMTDIILLFEMYHHQENLEAKYYHYSKYLPDYLNHKEHIDLDTMFYLADIKQAANADRESYAGLDIEKKKHNALYDAKIVRACYLKLIKSSRLKRLINF